MRLSAAESAHLALEAAKHGGSSASFVVVAGSTAGSRLLVLNEADGTEVVHGSLGSPEMDAAAVAIAGAALAEPRHIDGLRTLLDQAETYLEVRRPVKDLVIVGAGHIALPMARVGTTLGFRVWVLDDRPDFATLERFPEAYRVIRADFSDPFRDVPIHRGSHVLLVTRGHKYDYECLVRLLRTDPAPAYIGMIGSRRRVRATFVQLVADGISRERLSTLHAPVGLDIGAETPEEIAVAVAAELVLAQRGGTGAPLRTVERIAERFFNEGSEG